MAEKCLDLLVASESPDLITRAEESLELFRAGKAYSEPLLAPTPLPEE